MGTLNDEGWHNSTPVLDIRGNSSYNRGAEYTRTSVMSCEKMTARLFFALNLFRCTRYRQQRPDKVQRPARTRKKYDTGSAENARGGRERGGGCDGDRFAGTAIQ